MFSRCLGGMVLGWLALFSIAAIAQQSTSNGGAPTGFTTRPAPPDGPDSFTANPPSPPPSGADSLVSNPKPGKPGTTRPRPPEPVPPAPQTAAPRQPVEPDPAPQPPASPAIETAPRETGTTDPVATRALGRPRNPTSLVRRLGENRRFTPLQASPVGAPAEEGATFEPGQVLVQTTDISGARAVQNALATEGYRIRGRRIHRALGFVVMTLRTPPGKPVAMAVAELGARFPDLVVEANHIYRPLADEDHRRFGHDLVGWQGMPDCGAGIRLGMIDTPVAREHRALEASAVRTESVLPAGTAPADADHGTAVAAILVGNGEEAIQGLLPRAELLAVNAFRGEGKKMDTNVTLLLAALDRLLEEAVQILNLSFGGPPNRLLEITLQRFIDRGIAVVAAAGNDRRMPLVYPAGYDPVIAVTALDARRNALRDASRGDHIDFAAPGVDVWSARSQGGGRYYSGTSFATPFVTAMMALAAAETGDHNEAMARLAGAAVDLGDSGRDPVFGIGLVQQPGQCGGGA